MVGKCTGRAEKARGAKADPILAGKTPPSKDGVGVESVARRLTTAQTEGLPMPFYFFFGLLGLVVGGLLTWFFLAEHPFESLETPGGPVDPVEASLLAGEMAEAGTPIEEAVVTKLLELHGAYVDGQIRLAQQAAQAARLAGESAAQAAADQAPSEALAAGHKTGVSKKSTGAEQTK
jgi:hypothetical protein